MQAKTLVFELIYTNTANMHVGLTRNVGLAMACGEYVAFSDHDDYMDLDMLEDMYFKAKELDCDLLSTNILRLRDESIRNGSFDVGITPLRESFLITMYKKVSSLHSGGYVFGQLFRRKFLVDNHLLFVDSRYVSAEDNVFMLATYSALLGSLSSKFCYWNNAYYHHIVRPTSTGLTASYRNFDKRIATILADDEIVDRTQNIDIQNAKKYLLCMFTAYVYWFCKQELKHLRFCHMFTSIHHLYSNDRLRRLIHTPNCNYISYLTPPKNVLLFLLRLGR